MVSKVCLEFETIIPPIDPDIEEAMTDNICDKKSIMNNLGIGYDEDTNNCFIKDKHIYQYTFQLGVYVVNYNILKIVGGMGGVVYTK
jgi:hypothetical protein